MKRHLVILNLCVTALSVFGIMMLYSAMFKAADAPRFRSQINVLVAGVLLVPLLVRLDYGWLNQRRVLYLLGGACLVLLVAVFMPAVGIHINGASRWVRGLGQPSEFAKPALIAILAAWFARLSPQEIQDSGKGFWKPLLMGGLPALLIFFEPDWGTAALLGTLTLAMLFIAGVPWPRLAVTVVVAMSTLVVMVAHNPLRLERFLVFLDPEAHCLGAGWQIWQSILAIGSGGPLGHFLDGSLHKYDFVPEQQTDFIFARVGEETGLWGTSLVIALYTGILLCGFQIMKHARDRFGELLAAGCTIVIVLQAGINIAVATSMVPNKGLPLPFMSYGGSSLVAMFICVGLLGSVAWHSPLCQPPPEEKPVATQLSLF